MAINTKARGKFIIILAQRHSLGPTKIREPIL
jgi:hypothetical protein